MTKRSPTPNTIGVGFLKAGTTYISEVLSNHPQVCFSSPKETHYFTDQVEKGWEWYRDRFEDFRTDQHHVVAEWSNDYALQKKTLKQMRDSLGSDVTLLACYRRPVDAFESWIRYRLSGKEIDRTIPHNKLIKQMEEKYLHRFYYDQQLKNVLDVFPPDRLFVLHFKKMVDHPELFFKKLFNLLGIKQIPVYEKTQNTNTSHPFRWEKLRRITGFLTNTFYDKEQALNIFQRKMEEKPGWLRILQKLNHKDFRLPGDHRERLNRIFDPHMARLKRILDRPNVQTVE